MDLIVQGPALTSADIAAIARLADPQGIHALSGASVPAYRLDGAARAPGIAEYCAAAGIDHAFVPPDLRRDRVRVVAMDMDSTLITIECIDEIADRVGIKSQVAAITASAMRGEIDFTESLTRRVALLAGLAVTEPRCAARSTSPRA
jgi:phosphoserine phosphatase